MNKQPPAPSLALSIRIIIIVSVAFIQSFCFAYLGFILIINTIIIINMVVWELNDLKEKIGRVGRGREQNGLADQTGRPMSLDCKHLQHHVGGEVPRGIVPVRVGKEKSSRRGKTKDNRVSEGSFGGHHPMQP